MAFVIPPGPVPAVAVNGSDDLFPVHRVYCVGRNYADHAREMGHDSDHEPPFFFQKSPDNLLPAGLADGAEFPYPPQSQNVHFEIELVVALSGGGVDVSEQKALDLIWGYGVGIDMTRRDLQGEAKKAGRPWDSGKAFEHSAPVCPLYPLAATGHIEEGRIWLDVNGEPRQDGNVNQLIWKVPEILAHLSTLFELRPGSLLFPFPPSFFFPFRPGDVMEGGVEGVGEIKVRVT